MNLFLQRTPEPDLGVLRFHWLLAQVMERPWLLALPWLYFFLGAIAMALLDVVQVRWRDACDYDRVTSQPYQSKGEAWVYLAFWPVLLLALTMDVFVRFLWRVIVLMARAATVVRLSHLLCLPVLARVLGNVLLGKEAES